MVPGTRWVSGRGGEKPGPGYIWKLKPSPFANRRQAGCRRNRGVRKIPSCSTPVLTPSLRTSAPLIQLFHRCFIVLNVLLNLSLSSQLHQLSSTSLSARSGLLLLLASLPPKSRLYLSLFIFLFLFTDQKVGRKKMKARQKIFKGSPRIAPFLPGQYLLRSSGSLATLWQWRTFILPL